MAQIGSRSQRRSGVRWLSHYSSAQTILVVGDGDLSFSLALAAAFGSGHNLVATSLDSYDALMSKYGKAESNVTELERLGATVLHGVDAKTMKHHPCLKMRWFDRIVFNFPHAGFIGKENEDHMIKAHQLLVRSFFHNASHLLCPDGEIHVSHKRGQPYDRWKIEELASEFSLVMFDTVAFRKEHYPGYNQKRGDSDRCNEEFSLHNGYTVKFRVEREEAEECAQKDAFSTAAQRESLHRLQESLDAVTNLHKEKEQQLLMLWQDDAGHAVAFQNSLGRGARKVALVMHDDVLRATWSSRDDADEEDTAGIEELRIECLEYGGATHCIHAAPSQWPYYDLSLVSLPFVALRVLELTGCNLHMYPPSPLDEKEDDNDDDDDDDQDCWWRIVFPCLEVLWLRRCRTELGTLQGMVSAAPRLTDLRL